MVFDLESNSTSTNLQIPPPPQMMSYLLSATDSQTSNFQMINAQVTTVHATDNSSKTLKLYNAKGHRFKNFRRTKIC